MRVLYLSAFIVLFDQITKLLVKGFSVPFLSFKYEGMQLYESIAIIGDFFRLTFVENPGMAFGVDLITEAKLAVSLFSVIASIGMVLYLYYIRDHGFGTRLGLALVLGGAVGNLIDRVFYGVFFGYGPLFFGNVVDFFDFDFFDFELFGRTYQRWPIFNIADIAVTLGVLTLIIFHKSLDKTAAPASTGQNEPGDAAETPSEENVSEENVSSDGKPDNREEISI